MEQCLAIGLRRIKALLFDTCIWANVWQRECGQSAIALVQGILRSCVHGVVVLQHTAHF